MDDTIFKQKLKNIVELADLGAMGDTRVAIMRLARKLIEEDQATIMKRKVQKLKDGSYITTPDGGPATDAEIRAYVRLEAAGEFP
jgi:hypothetical protein